MRKLLLLVTMLLAATTVFAQGRSELRDELRKRGFSEREIDRAAGKLTTYDRTYARTAPRSGDRLRLFDDSGDYMGTLNRNRHDPDSVSNPSGIYGRRWDRMSDRQRKNLLILDEDELPTPAPRKRSRLFDWP